MTRDSNVNQILEQNGWLVLRFWGKDIKRNPSKCLEQIVAAMQLRESESDKHE